MKKKLLQALPAFGSRNFRLFWGGQLFSLIGTHMQTAAMSWLVLRLSNSSFTLGLLSALYMLPILSFSLFTGILADRMSKRRLILLTQCAFLVQAVALWLLVYSGRAEVWSLLALSTLQGAIHAFDAPARQSFVSEMVPHQHVQSAISLNSSIFNGARILGASAAGLIIHYAGESHCFLINAASYIAVLAGILMMRDSELFGGVEKREKSGKATADLIEGFRYAWREKSAFGLFVILTIVSVFGLPSLTLLPVFAKDILHVGAKGMGFLYAAAGGGAAAAVLILSFLKDLRRQGRLVLAVSFIFSVSLILFSQSKSYALSLAGVALAGGSVTSGIVVINSTLQLISPQNLRGRIMGIYIFILIGMAFFGNLYAGALAQSTSAPAAVMVSGFICVAGILASAAFIPAISRIDVSDKDAQQSSGGPFMAG